MMKTSKCLLIFVLCLIDFQFCLADHIRESSYQLKYNTTTHKMLHLEEPYANMPDSIKRNYFDNMYSIIDQLIDSSKTRLAPLLKSTGNYSKKEATVILQTIDSLLAEQYFIVCIIVNLLSEGLTPHKLTQFPCTPYLINYRRQFCKQHVNAEFYGVDCDLGALLYVSIGEVLQLPIHLVEVPTHNFVRWRFDDINYINYDNNSGGIYTDDDFRQGKSPTASTTFTPEEERKCHFLMDMDQNQITGYYISLIAIAISHEGRYDETEKLYKESISHRQWDVLPMNNLSWMYLTVPKYNTKAYYKEAYRLSSIVDQNLPSSIEYRDTYSCACAGIGDFVKALKIEKNANNKGKRIAWSFAF